MANLTEYDCAYRIMNIEEYGKFVSYCIQFDLDVFRSRWDEHKKGSRCYLINRFTGRVYHCDYDEYFEENGIEVKIPEFTLNEDGAYILSN